MNLLKKHKNLWFVIIILFILTFIIGVGKVGGDQPSINPYANTPRIATTVFEPSYAPVPVETFDPLEFQPYPNPTIAPTPNPTPRQTKPKKVAQSKPKTVRYVSRGWRWPIRGRLTSYFSGRHLGIDIAGDCGSIVRAAKSGKVIFSGWNSFGGGNDVKISHANGYSSDYAHLSKYVVRRGQYVAQGQRIGYRGRSGRATGCHLHFAMKRNGYFVNPLRYLP